MVYNWDSILLYTCIVYCFNILCIYVQYYTNKEYQIKKWHCCRPVNVKIDFLISTLNLKVLFGHGKKYT